MFAFHQELYFSFMFLGHNTHGKWRFFFLQQPSLSEGQILVSYM